MVSNSKLKEVLQSGEITDKSLRAAFLDVWNSDTVQKYEIKDKPKKKIEIIQRINRSSRNIRNNITHLKRLASKKKLKKNTAVDLDDLIEKTADDDYVTSCYSDYYTPKPEKLYKYVELEWAVKTVKGSYLHCGTAEYYRQKDATENKAFVGEPKETDDFYQLVMAEVISKLLKKKNVDLDEKTNLIQKVLDNLYFIGCLSDEPDSQALWNKFGGSGVCIEIEAADLNVHKITYNDSPIDPDYPSMMFRQLNEEVEYKSREEVSKKFDQLLRMHANIELLNRYRKDERWRYESEWRLLVDKHDVGENDNYPVKITKVVSCLPPDEHRDLQGWCEDHHIVCVRRKGFETY